MIGTLEEKLGVKFLPGATLHTDETNKWLRELCAKVATRFTFPRYPLVIWADPTAPRRMQ
jgi:lysyl-tRNA synthetase class 2